MSLTNEQVDCPGPDAMAAWLRETARNTRAKRDSPYLSQTEINLAPHVAFRLEQAAGMIEELQRENAELRAELGALAPGAGLPAEPKAPHVPKCKPDYPFHLCPVCYPGL